MPLNVSRIILVTYLRGAPTSTAVGLLGGIHPAQHFFEVVFDGFVAKAGPVAQRLRVTYQGRAAAGLQNPFRPERLNHPAGIAAATPSRGASCSCVSGTTLSPSVLSIAEIIHFAARCSIEWIALQAVDWNIWASMQSE